MGTLVLGGVFERHPKLRVVCVEADAGWVPHYMYRMDHAYKRHRNWLPAGQALSKLPSEYFAENIYTTFQDDWVAFKTADLMNWHRLMWANDFPHSDSTWPWSQEMLAEHAADLTRRAAARDPVRQRGRALRHRPRDAAVGSPWTSASWRRPVPAAQPPSRAPSRTWASRASSSPTARTSLPRCGASSCSRPRPRRDSGSVPASRTPSRATRR